VVHLAHAADAYQMEYFEPVRHDPAGLEYALIACGVVGRLRFE
jgi:hypothetical protein